MSGKKRANTTNQPARQPDRSLTSSPVSGTMSGKKGTNTTNQPARQPDRSLTSSPVSRTMSGKKRTHTTNQPARQPASPRKPASPPTARSLPEKPTSHYLAIEMGFNTPIQEKPKRKPKRSKSPDLESVPSLKTLRYEQKTVNSVADDEEFYEDLREVEKAPVPPRKRRKPAFIDSEVDLMRTPEARPPLNLSLLLKRRPMSAIKESASEVDVTAEKKRNRRKKLSKAALVKALVNNEPRKVKKLSPKMSPYGGALADPSDKYPVLKDKELVQRFLQIELTNNQKGRIRQVLKDILRGTSATVMPDVINNKIQAILKSSENLTDTDLRKIRILYNMLKKSIEELHKPPEITQSEEIVYDNTKDESKEVMEMNKNSKKDKKAKKNKELKNKGEKELKEKGDKESKKLKPIKKKVEKRYVVFVGNLPLKVTRAQILSHFEDIRGYIRDVRIPQIAEDKKSSYAYVEFDNAPVYEMALSKHHSMMGSKRINVLYTTQQNSKISKTDAKAKSAKLVAMAKKGTLIGSVPLQRKRSARRAKARAFQKQAVLQMEALAKK